MGIKRKANQKIIAIIGQTASGKSSLGVYLAQNFKGEIISADSRQVYKGMNIGTGKIKKEEMEGIPHHLIDILSPTKNFSVAQYVNLAEKKINQITKINKIPIICGGTAFYIDALVNKINIPKVSPNWQLRQKLEKETAEQLFKELQKLDPQRAISIDKKNKRRLIRALEIIKTTNKTVPVMSYKKIYNCLYIGIYIEQEKLNKKIEERLMSRLKEGMIKEVERIHEKGVSWQRLIDFGLEYKWISLYLQGKIKYDEMVKSLLNDIKKFSKRQKTWWKKNKKINWVKDKKDAYLLVEKFLSNSKNNTI